MAKKKTTKKKSAKKKAPAKKTTKKKTTQKKAAKKAVTNKVAKKKATKKVTKKTTKKKAAKQKTTKNKVTKKKATKSAASKKSTKKKTAKQKTAKKKPVKKAAPVRVVTPSPPTERQLLEQDMSKQWTVGQLKRVKTGLTKKEKNEYLKLLLERRAEIIGNVQGMEDARNASLGDIAHMPLHMADVGSDNFEQEFTLGLMESERQLLREIDEAILRMREGYYGVCLESGRPIQKMRLEFAPWAKYCIDVARLREKHGWK